MFDKFVSVQPMEGQIILLKDGKPFIAFEYTYAGTTNIIEGQDLLDDLARHGITEHELADPEEILSDRGRWSYVFMEA